MAGPKQSVLSGIDVSHHQGKVNWEAVAEAGIVFAFAKATEGVGLVDPQFAANWSGMKSAQLFRGAFHFFRPAKPAVAQAEKFVQAVKNLAAGDLPPVLDLEEARTRAGQDEWDAIPKADRLPRALRWLEAVEQRLGRRPIVYTRRGFLPKLGGAGTLAFYPLWIAHYTTARKPIVPAGWNDWTFWQFSEKGKVAGVATGVDRDKFSGSLNELRILSGLGPSKTAPTG